MNIFNLLKIILISYCLNNHVLAFEYDLEDVISGNIINKNDIKKNARLDFIKSISMEFGIYYGRKNHLRKFNESLNKHSETLEHINFAYLLIDRNMLPPIVVEANDIYEQENNLRYEEVKKLYRIVEGAKVVSSIPTWRDYLIINDIGQGPNIPSDFTLKGKDEKLAWEEGAKIGIEQGEFHAQNEIEYSYAKLKRDYKGMLLAHHLNDLNIISFSNLTKLIKGIIVEEKIINIGLVDYVSNDKDIFNEQSKWVPYIKDSEDSENKMKVYSFINDSELINEY